MLDNLLFSVRVVLPVFIMILLGTLGARAKILERDVMDKMARITFTWFLSVKIGLSTYDADLHNMGALSVTVFCCVGLTAAFAVIWVLAHRLIRRKESVGAFVHCSFSSSRVSWSEAARIRSRAARLEARRWPVSSILFESSSLL